MIDSNQLTNLVNDQLIVGFACLRPNNTIHGTPIWIATDGTKLFFYSKEERRKIHHLKNNPICTVIFNNGTVEGEAEIIPKTSDRFNKNYSYFGPRYNHDPNYVNYKKNWDIMVLITPKSIY